MYRCLFQIDSKMVLGLSGVMVVVVSVLTSVGFLSFMNCPVNFLIIEILPFLILAVGIDNMFTLVQAYQVSVYSTVPN